MPDTTRDTQRRTGGRIIEALRRTRPFALSIFLAYVLSSAAGIVMAHAEDRAALAARDKTVRKALASDEASIAYQSGNRARAVLFDLAGNVCIAAIPQTVAGLGVVLPYFFVAYQGWVGGVVSVDGAHRSRLRSIKTASSYFLVLLAQFIPFSLSIGAGVRCGLDLYRQNADVRWRFWRYRLPRESLVDVARVYAVTVPLFLVASAIEFFSPWNA